jgi:hypothetical protein
LRKIPGIEGMNVVQQSHMFIRNLRKCVYNILQSIKTTQVVNNSVCIIRYVHIMSHAVWKEKVLAKDCALVFINTASPNST